MTPRRATALRARGDDGGITLLSLGFAVLALLLILVVASATTLHIQRTRLTQIADELAIDGADAMDVAAYYDGRAGEPTDVAAVDLSNDAVRSVVNDHLAAYASRYHLDGVRVVRAESPDGNTAVVTVAVVVQPLFGLEALMPWTDGVTLTATSSSRAR